LKVTQSPKPTALTSGRFIFSAPNTPLNSTYLLYFLSPGSSIGLSLASSLLSGKAAHFIFPVLYVKVFNNFL
jgi:hypothetical protein